MTEHRLRPLVHMRRAFANEEGVGCVPLCWPIDITVDERDKNDVLKNFANEMRRAMGGLATSRVYLAALDDAVPHRFKVAPQDVFQRLHEASSKAFGIDAVNNFTPHLQQDFYAEDGQLRACQIGQRLELYSAGVVELSPDREPVAIYRVGREPKGAQ